ncbi:MAG: hypothetical protein ACQEP8_05145 [Chlamydiota bacterium]
MSVNAIAFSKPLWVQELPEKGARLQKSQPIAVLEGRSVKYGALDPKVLEAFNKAIASIQRCPCDSLSNRTVIKAAHQYLGDVSNRRRTKSRQKIVEMDRRLASAELLISQQSSSKPLDKLYYTPEARRLAEKWVSAKLTTEGQDLAMAVKYPAFCDMILKSFTHKHLQLYGHSLFEANDQPEVIVKGEKLSCSEFQAIYSLNDKGEIVSQEDNKPLYYHQEGFVEHDPVNWQELQPYRILEPAECPETPVLEVVTESDPHKAVLAGSHSWIRLIKPSGEVYSVGFFPDQKFFPLDGVNCGYAKIAETVKAKMVNTDVTEWVPSKKPENRTVLPLSITEDQFDKVFNHIHHMQSSRHNMLFNFTNKNCTAWVSEILSLVGEDVKPTVKLHEMLLPASINRLLNKVDDKTPSLMKWVWQPLKWSAFGICNLLFIITCGGRKGIFNPRTGEKERVFASWKDIFVWKDIYHPFPLRKWQEQRLSRQES